MKPELDQRCVDQLKRRLAEELPNVRVIFGSIIDHTTVTGLQRIDDVLPRRTRESLGSLVGDLPFFVFIWMSLARRVMDSVEMDVDAHDASVPLGTLPGFEDLEALADQLVGGFVSLPWRYLLTFELPAGLRAPFYRYVGDRTLSGDARIVTFPASAQSALPRRSGDGVERFMGRNPLGVLRPPEWDPDSAYLQMEADGFYCFGGSPSVQAAMRRIRAVLGIGVALGTFSTILPSRSSPTPSAVWVHRRIEKAWSLVGIDELIPTQQEVVDSVELAPAADEAERKARILFFTDRLALVLAQQPVSDRIIRGAQWLLDSHGGQDAVLQVVQATVALETLLGDKAASDEVGLVELLANRCAYLVARTQTDRDVIIQDFKDAYELRSRIVHDERDHLSPADRMKLSNMRSLCSRVIRKEIDMLRQPQA